MRFYSDKNRFSRELVSKYQKRNAHNAERVDKPKQHVRKLTIHSKSDR